MEITPELNDRIQKLADKYHASGQELIAYLDGLLYAEYNTYWDYVHLDTLLSLQTPRTSIPDEEIFIMYHQITELYFKLTLHEMRQMAEMESVDLQTLKTKLGRMNRYFSALTHSFGVMEKGMDREQFLKFRMSLIPASGFQSAQYRMVEIGATDFINLVDKEVREGIRSDVHSIEEMYENIYWKKGATLEKTGEKTLTLKQFEKKYSEELIRMAYRFRNVNIWQLYTRLPAADQKDQELIDAYRALDLNVNVNWPLQHYRTSVVYLARRPNDIAATGGTNWQKYLPPRFQKRIFYPELWSDKEIEEWGKGWVKSVLEEVGPGK
ncbi:MAG TPA: tryptophan 2,3-dioxygenase [Cryomorphaceae bacterium]|nr:tryptophan 2,3-dioxygenase [Owenweeksia sp.]MBF98344.1 tryptophan 2,3-dioxygenase [Owenweeksia sp.]HAD97585.1 tryptophan 2,3-dioxygenase [Cryomorphaceae bacterium]|tara:strand:+ start:2521 stop:3492 length:972 start_codon:yes stop_codon:yes gene_type:complete